MLSALRGWVTRRLRPGGHVAETVDFRALAENSLDLIVRCNSDQIASYASPAVMRMLGIRPEELIGRSHLAFIVPEDLPIIEEVLARHFAGAEEAHATFRMVRKDGTIIWVEGSGRMVKEPVTGATEFIVVMHDVTEHKLWAERIQALALTDALTGLANRRAFDDALTAEWLRTKRDGTMLSLLLLDVDCFKAFNDHYGHQTGDDCLRAVASAIRTVVRRPGDLVARYGGEEIAVILPDTEGAGATAIAASVLDAVEALRIPHEWSMAGCARVSVSIGCATAVARLGASVQMPESLLRAADSALYRAKAEGRNRVETALLLTSTISA